MEELILRAADESGITDTELKEILAGSIRGAGKDLRKVLLLPPDITRSNSGAGKMTAMYYELLKESCQVDVMPALGTHMPMDECELREMFGENIPVERFIIHDWRKDVVKIGEVPGEFIRKVSEGLMDGSIDVEVNRRLLDRSYDLIISMGQVVPHEVVGIANYSKNIFVGCGGSKMINSTHMLGAVYGLERVMGKDRAPVRQVFDYSEENYIKDLPIMYVLTVTTQKEGRIVIHGVFTGRRRSVFEAAVALCQEKNMIYVEKPIKKAVTFLDEKEFKSTWIGNKAVYRTRMAIADGGELLILAPGVRQFGEDPTNDVLIRKYGYVGRMKVLDLFRKNEDLQRNQSVAAHLIHGSSDDRFTITYAVEKLTKDEVAGVNYLYQPLREAYKKYNPEKLKNGFNTLEDGEEIYFIDNPALGLWIDRGRL